MERKNERENESGEAGRDDGANLRPGASVIWGDKGGGVSKQNQTKQTALSKQLLRSRYHRTINCQG